MDKSDIVAVTPAQPGTKALYLVDGEVVVEDVIAWVTVVVNAGDPEMFPMTLTDAKAEYSEPDVIVMPGGTYSQRNSDVTEQQIREALQYDNNVYTGK